MHQATTKYCNTCLAPGAHEPLAFCSSCAHISAHTHPPSCALSSNTNAPHLLLPPTRCCPPPVVAPHPPKKNARRRAKLNRNEPYYCAICEESLLTKGTKSLARTPFIVRVNATPGFSTDSVLVSAFHVSNTSREPFQCVHCQLEGQVNEPADLRVLVSTLQAEVSELRDKGSSALPHSYATVAQPNSGPTTIPKESHQLLEFKL